MIPESRREDRAVGGFDPNDVKVTSKFAKGTHRDYDHTLCHVPTGLVEVVRTPTTKEARFKRAMRTLEMRVLTELGEPLPLSAAAKHALREMQETNRPLLKNRNGKGWVVPPASGPLGLDEPSDCRVQDVQDLASAGLVVVSNGRRAVLTDAGRGWKG